jgi:hypothetical protein
MDRGRGQETRLATSHCCAFACPTRKFTQKHTSIDWIHVSDDSKDRQARCTITNEEAQARLGARAVEPG